MKNKRMMSAAIAVLMAGSLAACGGSTTASSTADTLPLGVYELPHGLFLRTGVDPGGHHRPCYRYPVQNPERMGTLRS